MYRIWNIYTLLDRIKYVMENIPTDNDEMINYIIMVSMVPQVDII